MMILIMKKLLEKNLLLDLNFPKEKWELRDDDFINLIKMCLTKKPELRIKIEDFINDDIFKKYNLKK